MIENFPNSLTINFTHVFYLFRKAKVQTIDMAKETRSRIDVLIDLDNVSHEFFYVLAKA